VSQKQTGASMAWNDENNKNPWGGSNQTPPELDEVIKDFKNKFNTRFGGGSSGKGSVGKAAKGSFKYFVILAVLLWLLSGIYIVDPAEKGVVLRFGAYQNTTYQCPHWRIPYPIESV